MPGLDSTLLNQAYSTPFLFVHTFLQVTEQVWQPMHLSRLKTKANCARTFMMFSYVPFTLRRYRRGLVALRVPASADVPASPHPCPQSCATPPWCRAGSLRCRN